MKKEIALRWAAALKSKKYKQGAGLLRNSSNGFCCLGVLCNLHAQDHPEIAREQTRKGMYLNETTDLPFEVAEWAGVKSFVCGNVRLGKTTAIQANDILMLSFDEIGDLVLQHWETI